MKNMNLRRVGNNVAKWVIHVDPHVVQDFLLIIIIKKKKKTASCVLSIPTQPVKHKLPGISARLSGLDINANIGIFLQRTNQRCALVKTCTMTPTLCSGNCFLAVGQSFQYLILRVVSMQWQNVLSVFRLHLWVKLTKPEILLPSLMAILLMRIWICQSPSSQPKVIMVMPHSHWFRVRQL